MLRSAAALSSNPANASCLSTCSIHLAWPKDMRVSFKAHGHFGSVAHGLYRQQAADACGRGPAGQQPAEFMRQPAASRIHACARSFSIHDCLPEVRCPLIYHSLPYTSWPGTVLLFLYSCCPFSSGCHLLRAAVAAAAARPWVVALRAGQPVGDPRRDPQCSTLDAEPCRPGPLHG